MIGSERLSCDGRRAPTLSPCGPRSRFGLYGAACSQRVHDGSTPTDRQCRPGKRRGVTKPGTLLKNQIRSHLGGLDEKRPGFCESIWWTNDGRYFVEVPSPGHLCFTDVVSAGPNVSRCGNKAQQHVFAAIQPHSSGCLSRCLGIDSDNGAEFINDQLYRYCLQEQITFTRGRAGRKNDNPYVEQKNWSVVRRAVGYYRYENSTGGPAEQPVCTAPSLHQLLPAGNEAQEKARVGHKVSACTTFHRPLHARVEQRSRVGGDKAQLREHTATSTWSTCEGASTNCKTNCWRP